MKTWLAENGSNLFSRYMTFQLAERHPTDKTKENHSKFLEGCLLRLVSFHFKDVMMPINQSGTSVVGALPLAISRFTRDDYDIMSVAVALLSNFLDPASLTKYQQEKVARPAPTLTPERLQCTLCSSKYTWREGLYKHMLVKHPAALKARSARPPKQFHCTLCSIAFSHPNDMVKHM